MLEYLLALENILFYKGFGSLIAYVACIALAIIVIMKSPKNKLNITFASVAMLAAAWNMIVYYIINTSSAMEAMYAWRLYASCTILLLTLLTYFCSIVANKKIHLSRLMLATLILIPLIMFSPFFVSGATNINGIFFQEKASAFITLEIYRMFMIITSLYFLYLGYKTYEESTKIKIKLVALGIGTTLVTAAIDIILRVSGFNLLPFSSIATIITVWLMSRSFKAGDIG